MRLCCNCGKRIFDEDDGYCYRCNGDVFIETTEIKTASIRDELEFYDYLDLLTLLEIILDSIGSDEEKLYEIKWCVLTVCIHTC